MKNKIKWALLAIAFVGCTSDDNTEFGNWIERSVFDGIPRSNAIGFVIGNKGFMGTGYDGDDYLNDFWQYDLDNNYWEQKANFPGKGRSSAIGFATDSKGYLGTGYDGDIELSDFWEYNPNTNEWIQKTSFGGGARRAAVSFEANGFGYAGTGYDGDNDKKDFWKYNSSTDEWDEILGFAGDKRRDAVTFKIDDKAYLGTGVSNGIYVDDFWEFDPNTEVWSRLKDLTEEDDYNVVRSNAVGFSIEGIGYIATGYTGGATGSIWAYEPITDTWEESTSLEAYVRQDAVSFTKPNSALILLGRSGSLYFDDNYEFFPNEEYNEDD